MPTLRILPLLLLPLIALGRVTTAADSSDTVTLPPPSAGGSVIVAPGVTDDFDPVREAVAEVKRRTDRDYRVVVVESTGREGGAATLLPKLVDRWWEARTEGSGFDPAGDVTIVLDVGDRSIAMDVPPSLLAEAGLDLDDLEREVITKVFVPRAKDMQYAAGLSELVKATQGAIEERIAARAARRKAAEVFRTRTLPLSLACLVGVCLIGWLAFLRARHASRRAAALEKLAAFKSEVVALSDLLDAQRERHRMLPHADPDFRTPMLGMTRSAYDAVQDAILRYRERWLGLMDVWERAEQRLGEEWSLGTTASDDVVAMLDAAEARPPLAEVEAACRAPLDALETAHELARDLATELDADLATARRRLDALATRGRSAATFEPTLAAAGRSQEQAATELEGDPVAARGRLEDARAALAALTGDVEAIETGDDRRRHLLERVAEIRRLVAARRSDGWLLTEPGADPELNLAEAEREAALAAELLDAVDVETATMHLARAEGEAAEAATLLQRVAEARERSQTLQAAVAARIESIAAALPAAEADLAAVRQRYATTAWEDLSDNPAQAAAAVQRSHTLLAEGRAEAEPARQWYFRAVALLEEAERQVDWSAACLDAVASRRLELDDLATALPELHRRAATRIADLATDLARQRTDRARANERCREAERLLDVAATLAAAPRPDPRQVELAVRAAETAAARGADLAAEDARLAAQAAADLSDAEGLYRRAASWYSEGVKADVGGLEQILREARRLLSQQRYEESIRLAGESAERARRAYAAATEEAERRRARRLAEQRRRQLEESFSRMTRGAGPWVISLPSGGLTGPNPWRSSGSFPRLSGGSARSGGSRWSRDVAEVRW
jgi:hypothetical protein